MRKSLLLVVIFFSFFVLDAQNSFNKKILATVGNQKVTVGSFLNIYTKNNLGSSDTVSIKHAVNLYIDFRLKVLSAEKKKLDTLASFKGELAGYRSQLVKPYFENKKVEDALLKQAYQRSRYDIRASHILIKLPQDASPADTLKAWNKIEKIRNEIINGNKSFRQAAIKYSDDPSARNQKAIPGLRPARRGNGGDLGFFTVFNMVYPFESAAYNTPVGQISQPVRTRYGYHLIKVTAKRPAMGVAQVEHIFIPMKPGTSATDSLKKVREIDAIYQKIKEGMPFEKAAKLYSQDKGSSYMGGRLPKFTSGRIVPQFVVNVDSLKRGQISKPFQTIYGFHIIKLLSRKKPGTFKQDQASLRSQLEGNQRSNLIKNAVIDKLKKEDHLKIFSKAKQQIFAVLIKKLEQGKLLYADSLKNLVAPLVKIGRKNTQTFSQYDFADYVGKYQQKLNPKGYRPLEIEQLFDKYTGEKLIAYEKLHLGEHHPGFKGLMQEYHDGVLLFNLTNKMVWSKATKDSAGLKKYYFEHQSNYQWKPRVHAIVLKTSKQKISKLESELHTYKNPDSALVAIDHKKIPGFPHIAVDSGYYEKGDNIITDQVRWVKGISKPVFEKGNQADIVLIENVLPVSQKPYKDARGLVIADYQNLLQKRWVENLRKKYPVHVNQKVLRKLEKKYPVKK